MRVSQASGPNEVIERFHTSASTIQRFNESYGKASIVILSAVEGSHVLRLHSESVAISLSIQNQIAYLRRITY
jgi:hypothetical protein